MEAGRIIDAFDSQALDLLLRVRHCGLDLALAVRIAYPTRHSNSAVMREDIAVERIQRGIVDVRLDDAFTKLSSTTMHVDPPSRRKARSWSSAHTFVLDRGTISRTDLRE